MFNSVCYDPASAVPVHLLNILCDTLLVFFAFYVVKSSEIVQIRSQFSSVSCKLLRGCSQFYICLQNSSIYTKKAFKVTQQLTRRKLLSACVFEVNWITISNVKVCCLDNKITSAMFTIFQRRFCHSFAVLLQFIYCV